MRDAASRAVLIGPPIIQLLVFGYAATFDLKHVPFVVYNQDQGQLSRDFIARFAGSPSFELLRIVHNQNALEQAIDDKSALMAMDIGPNFTSDLERGRTTHVQTHPGRQRLQHGWPGHRLRPIHRNHVQSSADRSSMEEYHPQPYFWIAHGSIQISTPGGSSSLAFAAY